MEALIIIFLTGLITMFIALAKKPALVLGTAVTGLLAALVIMCAQWHTPFTWITYPGILFGLGALTAGITATLFALLLILAGYTSYKNEPEHTGEYISLLIFSLCGVLCMLSFTDMFMFFLGLEIMSIPIYVMAGSKKYNLLSTEASLKYFFTGAFATGLLLFGTAWLYGAVGTFNLDEIRQLVSQPETHSGLMYVGILLILASFLFKIGAAPFHFWGPDVYAGSPNVVTGFMASVVKMAAFLAFIQFFMLTFGGTHEFWSPILIGLSVVTMLVGNLSALRQVTFKRLLAYSSITHVGYALMVVVLTQADGFFISWTYFFAYGFAIIALITVSLIFGGESDDLENYRGLAKRNPIAGTVFVLGLLSLAGVPPLTGFFAKYLLFSSAMYEYPVLTVIALANSGIAIYYYVRMIKIAVSDSDEGSEKVKLDPLHLLVLIVCALGMLGGGAVTWLL